MDPTIGRIVLYTLSEQDAKEINRRRTSGPSIAQRMDPANHQLYGAWPAGAQAHIGNEVHSGETYPMIIVAVWSPTCVNGQVFLDGTDTFWAPSRSLGNFDGQWCWPPRN
jgi:hypothetical protein